MKPNSLYTRRHTSHFEQYQEFDYFLTQPDLPNPWQTDCTEYWEYDRQS